VRSATVIGEPNDQPNQQLLYPTGYYAQMETTVVTKPHELYGKRGSHGLRPERTGKAIRETRVAHRACTHKPSGSDVRSEG
jgi:hypothetical protein